MKGLITMSNKEANRVAVLDQLLNGLIKQKQAARMLDLSTRQIIRLKKKYKAGGAKSLVHKNRGRVSNNKIKSEKIKEAIKLINKHYHDFGPTLAHEKLTENHQVDFGLETLRQAMIAGGVWKPKRKRKVNVYQLRPRRQAEGELIQIDGSPHAWFEDRGPYCNLLAFIDDATGKIKWLEFVPEETTLGYMRSTKGYLNTHGKPLSFYADKHSVFRINSSRGGSAATTDSHGYTQYARALSQLDIQLIPAHSAQAKGRVEKLFETLQDRLVKELRLKGINSIKEGNKYLPEFIHQYNLKFAVKPKVKANAHRPLLPTDNLDKIFTIQHTRILSKNLTCQYGNQIYQIQIKQAPYTMRRAPVLVRQHLNGKISIEYKGKTLKYTLFDKYPKANIVNSKQLNFAIDKLQKHTPKPKTKTPWKPPTDHPWRQYAS